MNRKGQTLIVVLGILVIFMIFIPAIVYMTRQEALWTVKQKRTTAAFHAAEAGIDRAMWKLRENSTNWESVMAGGHFYGYMGLTPYDVYAGTDNTKLISQYKVNIDKGTLPDEVDVTAVGRDPSTNEVRAIKVVLSKTTIAAPLSVDASITWKPNLHVHWGSVVSYNNITGGSLDYYPRKYAKQGIEARDTNDNTPPNTDGQEWWSFQDLGDPPQIDLAYYKAKAKASQIPTDANGGMIRKATGSNAAVADPPGSGYFKASDNGAKIRFFGSYDFRNSTSVIYVEGAGMDFSGSSFLDVEGALAEGSIDFNAGSTVYIATVPANAAEEYKKQKLEVPGYTYPGEGSADGTYTITDCGMHGFLYCGGTLTNSGGGSTIVGAAKVIGDNTMNTLTVFYDPIVATNIKLSAAKLFQKSWAEIKGTW